MNHHPQISRLLRGYFEVFIISRNHDTHFFMDINFCAMHM
jgi:hypothetical protein